MKKVARSLEALGLKLRKAHKRKYDLMREHDDLFKEIEELDDEIKELEIKIKNESRERAVEGSVVNTVDVPGLRVSVSFKRKRPTYDFLTAKRSWDRDIFRRTLRVDPDAVHKLINEGKLTEEDAQLAAIEGEEMTPAVTISFDPQAVDGDE